MASKIRTRTRLVTDRLGNQHVTFENEISELGEWRPPWIEEPPFSGSHHTSPLGGVQLELKKHASLPPEES